MAMTAFKVAARPRLAPYVEYIRVVGDVPDAETYVRLPDGRVELTLRLAGPSVAVNVVGTRLAVQSALRQARCAPGATWGRIALANGYWDQGHMNAEFRAHAGAAPRAMR